MSSEELGICPHCESQRGPVGSPCMEPLCVRKGYRFVPKPWHDSARDFALRRRRPPDPLLGRLLDKYLLSGLLGEGGMGAVYLALQMPLRREVALKLISGLALTEAAMARFEREARAISALEHPNIVKLYDYGVGELDFPVPYMVLEYVRHGRTLGEALNRMRSPDGRVPIEAVRVIFRQVLHALAAAHKIGIIHRDMKPDNVMIAPVEGQPYQVKVLDFGLAKAVAEVTSGGLGPGDGAPVSRTGQILGTPYYMAPEQAPPRGRPYADPRSDLYAVGVMLYEVFTGVRAYDGRTPLEVLMKKGDPGYRPLDLPEARVLPPRLRAFLERAMAVNPADRYGSADEMLAALEETLSGEWTGAKGLPEAWVPSDRPDTPTEEDGLPRTCEAKTPPSPAGSALSLRGETDSVKGGTESGTTGSVHPSPTRRRVLLMAPSLAGLAVLALVAWWLSDHESPPPNSSSDVETRVVAVQPEPLAEPDILTDSGSGEGVPVMDRVDRSFLVETIPDGASVEIEGRFRGKAPVTYAFSTVGDEWRTKEVVIRATASGFAASTLTVTLLEAVEKGRVVLRLEPETRPRPERRARRGLDGILGPDVEADRGRTAPSSPGPPPTEEPQSAPPARKEPPSKKRSIPML